MWSFFSSTSESKPNLAECPIDHRTHDKSEQDQKRSLEKMSHENHLTTQRVISSIPRYRAELNTASQHDHSSKIQQDNSSACPITHTSPAPAESDATAEQQNWVYPSPSQFYQALKRKNRNPRAEDMYTVVPIHNAVNERVWTQVLEWEAGYGKGAFDRWPRSGKSGPMLCSFRGRPNDLSPRAWIKVLSGYQAPFDRHDWEVIRPTEKRMRYVVDFYAGRGADNGPTNQDGQLAKGTIGAGARPNLAFYLDVRPALDSWEGVRMRVLRSTREFFKSIVSLSPTSTSSRSSSQSSDNKNLN